MMIVHSYLRTCRRRTCLVSMKSFLGRQESINPSAYDSLVASCEG